MSIVTIGISNYIGYQILIIIGKEKRMLINSIFGVFLNIVLNYILIKQFQHNGAAIASMFTEVVVCILYLYAYHKYIGLNWFPRYISKVIISSAVMTSFVLLCLVVKLPLILSCFTSAVCGGIVYAVVSILMKNEIAIIVWKQMYNKIKFDKEIRCNE